MNATRQVVSLYVNGALADSANFPGFSGSGTIGAAIGNSNLLSGGAFQGNIDELRISNVALPPSQFIDAVPEPGMMSLMVVAAAFMFRRGRRMTSASSRAFPF